MLNLTRFSLEGKVALVTGRSRGIGEAASLGFADAGASGRHNNIYLSPLIDHIFDHFLDLLPTCKIRLFEKDSGASLHHEGKEGGDLRKRDEKSDNHKEIHDKERNKA